MFGSDLTSVIEGFNRYHIVRKDFHNWRLTKRVVGSIQGLPGSHGVVTMTNGMLCVIERINQTPFVGHLDFFIPDDKGVAELEVQSGPTLTLKLGDKPDKATKLTNELMNLLGL